MLMVAGTSPAIYSNGVGDTAKLSDTNAFCLLQPVSSTITLAADIHKIFFIY